MILCNKKAFTLIELLVVISIIALLIGILLPALGAARQTAQKIKCATQMRQFTQANQMYAVDNDDHIVPAFPGSNHNVDPFWAHFLYPYMGMGKLEPNGAPIEITSGDHNVYLCPTSTDQGFRFVDGQEHTLTIDAWNSYTYTFNLMAPHWAQVRTGITGAAVWQGIKDGTATQTMILNPSQTAFLVEGTGIYINTPWYWTYPMGLMPHNDSANVPYYDGHTGTVSPQTEVPTNSDGIFWGGSNKNSTYFK